MEMLPTGDTSGGLIPIISTMHTSVESLVPNAPPSLVGAIEAGGTKFVCAIGIGPDAGLRARQQFPTGDNPERLLADVVAWFSRQQERHGRLAAIGVASFGPVGLDEQSATHGFITTTPKPGWRNFDLLGPLRRAFPGVPLAFDTDVNGYIASPALEAEGIDTFIVPPRLGDDAGICGAMALAHDRIGVRNI
jgi:predicted NBD/HSP70 family sugar kinase